MERTPGTLLPSSVLTERKFSKLHMFEKARSRWVNVVPPSGLSSSSALLAWQIRGFKTTLTSWLSFALQLDLPNFRKANTLGHSSSNLARGLGSDGRAQVQIVVSNHSSRIHQADDSGPVFPALCSVSRSRRRDSICLMSVIRTDSNRMGLARGCHDLQTSVKAVLVLILK